MTSKFPPYLATGPPQHSIQQTSVGRSPVQACEDGKPEQNKLLLPRAELPYDKTGATILYYIYIYIYIYIYM